MKKIFSLFAAVLFAGSMMAETVTLTMEDFAAANFTDQTSGITVATAKNAGTNAPVYVATGKDLRIYAKGSITISAEKDITGISFAISAQGKKRLAPLTADAGNVVVVGDPDFTVEWTGPATSVTLTVGDQAEYGTEGASKAGQLDFTAIEVTLVDGSPAALADGFYLVGSMNNWAAAKGYLFTKDNEAEAEEYVFNATFAANDEFKVRSVVEGAEATWYPEGMGNNFTITEAGEYTVYFRPGYDGNEEWHERCLKAVKKEVVPEGGESVTLLDVDFTQGQGEWTIDNKVLPEDLAAVWQQSAQYGMKASAFANSTKYVTESWLISPAINLSSVSEAVLAVNQAVNYCTPADFLAIKATKDGEQWTDLTLDAWPAGNNWNWVDGTADMKDFAGEQNVKIAFVYKSSADAAGTWEIKTVKITNGKGGEVPPVDNTFESLEALVAADLAAGTEVTVSFKDAEITGFYKSSQEILYGVYVNVKAKNDKNLEIYYRSEAVPAAWAIGGKVSGTIEGKWDYFDRDSQWEIVPTTANWTWTNLTYAAGEIGDPTNCAEAAAAALSVSENNELFNNGQEYTIEGYVTSIAYAWKDGSMSFWMADTEDGGNVLEAYKCAVENEADAPKIGDKVAVTGKLTKYGTTPEFAEGCTVEIKERATAPVNLGEKTIAEFLELKNRKDTCILTGVVKNIKKNDDGSVNIYGNFDLEDETESVYVYGLLTAEGEAKKFAEMGIEEGDTLTILALYNEFNGAPQVKNGIYVSHVKGEGGGEDEDHPLDEDADFAAVFASYTIDDSDLEEYGNLYVEAMDDEGYYIVLDITLPEGAEGLVAGIYPVDDSYEYPYQTVTAGIYDEESAYPSFAAVLGEEGIENIWWIVAGEVIVDEELNITVDAVNSLGREVVALLAAPGESAVETTKVAGAAVKSIENAMLIIERNGVRYNVMGQVVR